MQRKQLATLYVAVQNASRVSDINKKTINPLKPILQTEFIVMQFGENL